MSIGTGEVVAPQQPATIADEQVGINGAIAAALTRAVGSMPALYVALVIVGGWMALATWGPLRSADPYPFPFLLFLDNVVQLVLCLAILVGQRVLGTFADRRAVQTYENAEAIFAQIADLHQHLDRHDRALSRGVSLLETSPHPWVERHRVQHPPQALDQAVSLNGRIAAWLTERLGSMWAFYAAGATQLIWIVLGAVDVQQIDPYPYAFMSFLSTLAQLIFMIVIMVGQEVLGRTADRRSEQTFLDAEAILHECERMKARLTAQDRIIDSISGYTNAQVTERLAQAIHDTQARSEREQAAIDQEDLPEGTFASRPWAELPEELRESTRAQARQLGEQLAVIGCVMVPSTEPVPASAFDDEEAQLLARMEHGRWVHEQTARGYVYGPVRAGRTHPDLMPWEELSEQARAKHVEAARRIPEVLAGAGFQILRDDRNSRAGAGEVDFTPEDWAVLQQALMASGVLVALAEGVVDAEEMFVLIKKLRQASTGHPSRFMRELTAASNFNTGLQPSTRYSEYEVTAVQAIRSATAIIARIAPDEFDAFRAFLVEIAEDVADANLEGGFLGFGAHRRVASEEAAIEVVRRATEIED